MIMKKSSSSEIPIQTYWTKSICRLFRTSEFNVCDVKALVLYRRENETKPNKPKLSIFDFGMYIHNFSQRNKLRVWSLRPKVKVIVEVHITHNVSQTAEVV